MNKRLRLWLFVLLMELFWFYYITKSVHQIDDVLFIMTLIFVSLVVGVVIAFKPRKP